MREVVVERELDRGLEVHLGLPAELLLDVVDRGHALLDVLIIFSEVGAGGNLHDLGGLHVFGVVGVILEGGDDELGEVGHAHVVAGVADVEDLARGLAVLVLNDAEECVHAVVDEGEGAALLAAVDELEGLLEDDVGDELREEARAAFLRLHDVVELRPDPVEGAEESVVHVVAHAVGVDDAVEELLGGGVDPALALDRAVNHRAGRLVEFGVGAHAVDLGGGREDDAFFVFRALADDVEVGLEIQFEDAQRIFHVLDRVGDGDEGDDGVALLDVILDPLAVDGDVALDEGEAGVAQAGGELVAADIHAVDLPVLLLENGAGEAAADETVGSEDEDFEWHGI